jgi:hypothetical protein
MGIRSKSGYKINEYVVQYFDDGNPTGTFYDLTTGSISSSISVCGNTYTVVNSGSASASGRYYECLYNINGGPGPSNPYPLITSSFFDIALTPNSWSLASSSINVYADTYPFYIGTLLAPGTTLYRSGSLTAVTESLIFRYSGSNRWYQTFESIGGVGLVDSGLYENFGAAAALDSFGIGTVSASISITYDGTPIGTISPNVGYRYSTIFGSTVIMRVILTTNGAWNIKVYKNSSLFITTGSNTAVTNFTQIAGVGVNDEWRVDVHYGFQPQINPPI